MVNFYLVRNTERCGSNYFLTNYVPFAPPRNSPDDGWYFACEPKQFEVPLCFYDAKEIFTSLEIELSPGECVNLHTKEVTELKNAIKVSDIPQEETL